LRAAKNTATSTSQLNSDVTQGDAPAAVAALSSIDSRSWHYAKYDNSGQAARWRCRLMTTAERALDFPADRGAESDKPDLGSAERELSRHAFVARRQRPRSVLGSGHQPRIHRPRRRPRRHTRAPNPGRERSAMVCPHSSAIPGSKRFLIATRDMIALPC
jgi:hypothetical protein